MVIVATRVPAALGSKVTGTSCCRPPRPRPRGAGDREVGGVCPADRHQRRAGEGQGPRAGVLDREGPRNGAAGELRAAEVGDIRAEAWCPRRRWLTALPTTLISGAVAPVPWIAKS